MQRVQTVQKILTKVCREQSTQFNIYRRKIDIVTVVKNNKLVMHAERIH